MFELLPGNLSNPSHSLIPTLCLPLPSGSLTSGASPGPRKVPSRVMSIMSHVSNALAMEQQRGGHQSGAFAITDSGGSDALMKRSSKFEPQDLEGVDFDRRSNASSYTSRVSPIRWGRKGDSGVLSTHQRAGNRGRVTEGG